MQSALVDQATDEAFMELCAIHDKLTYIIDFSEDEKIKNEIRNARSSVKAARRRVSDLLPASPMIEPTTKELKP